MRWSEDKDEFHIIAVKRMSRALSWLGANQRRRRTLQMRSSEKRQMEGDQKRRHYIAWVSVTEGSVVISNVSPFSEVNLE